MWTYVHVTQEVSDKAESWAHIAQILFQRPWSQRASSFVVMEPSPQWKLTWTSRSGPTNWFMLIYHPLVNICLGLATLSGLTRPLWEVLSSFTGVKPQQGVTGLIQQSTRCFLQSSPQSVPSDLFKSRVGNIFGRYLSPSYASQPFSCRRAQTMRVVFL